MALILSIFSVLYLFFLLWLRNGLHRFNTEISKRDYPKISVIVAARNEEENIGVLLKALLKQNYPSDRYEVIIANDNSTDSTEEIINQFAKDYPSVRQVVITETPSNWSPKKWALFKAIEISSGKVLVFTDADCTMGSRWLRTIVSPFRKDEIGIVTGPSPLEKNRSLWDKMLFLDSIGQDAFTAGTISRGLPLTCSGRNLAVRRSAFDEVVGYSEIESFISGDDDLLMHKITSAGREAYYVLHPDVVVNSPPPAGVREFTVQRLRFASKGRYYYTLPFTSDKLKTVLPFIFITNLSVLIGQIAFVVSLNITFLIPWLIKITGDELLMAKYVLFLSRKINFAVLTLTSIWHSLYVVLFGLLGSFIPISWKDRNCAPKLD